jgi:hypothetical protein
VASHARLFPQPRLATHSPAPLTANSPPGLLGPLALSAAALGFIPVPALLSLPPQTAALSAPPAMALVLATPTARAPFTAKCPLGLLGPPAPNPVALALSPAPAQSLCVLSTLVLCAQPLLRTRTATVTSAPSTAKFLHGPLGAAVHSPVALASRPALALSSPTWLMVVRLAPPSMIPRPATVSTVLSTVSCPNGAFGPLALLLAVPALRTASAVSMYPPLTVARNVLFSTRPRIATLTTAPLTVSSLPGLPGPAAHSPVAPAHSLAFAVSPPTMTLVVLAALLSNRPRAATLSAALLTAC